MLHTRLVNCTQCFLNTNVYVFRVVLVRSHEGYPTMEPDLEVAAAAHPAYSLEPQQRQGPQCSQHNDWCFFCEYASTCDGDIDLRATLVTVVGVLQRDHRELAHIVDAVFVRYDQSIRPHVEGNREWTKQSIQRHLLYSNEFASLFGGLVTHVFQTIIENLNQNMMDDENKVVDGQRRAFLETVKGYQAWTQSTTIPKRGAKRGRKD